jgi:ribonuclease HI
VRVHIDRASRGNPGPAGIGVLFLGPDGAVVEQMHRGIGEATNNVAEYSALLAALDRAATLGITDLEVYSDSELLVRQLQGRYQVKHPVLRPLYAAARKRIAAFSRFAIHHVPRELNAEADALANRGIDAAARRARRPPATPDRGGEG